MCHVKSHPPVAGVSHGDLPDHRFVYVRNLDHLRDSPADPFVSIFTCRACGLWLRVERVESYTLEEPER